jgi:hypothetical protein
MVFLIILDLFWAIAALWVDLPKLATIPAWAWPVVFICPVYPLLLLIVWWQIRKGKEPNRYVLALGAIGGALFGVLAVVFYPLTMIEGGWNWRAFGQIFWVLFYSAQGWYLVITRRMSTLAVGAAAFYLLLKLILDFKFKSFGYLEISSLRTGFQIALLGLGLAALAAISLLASRRAPR